jgi:hypothetical protein
MDDFIYKEKSLTPEFCNKIMDLYNVEKKYIPGCTYGGVDKDIKDTNDYCIPSDIEQTSEWYDITEKLSEEMNKHLSIYIKRIKDTYNTHLLDAEYIADTGFMVQKYEKQKGKYIHHIDSRETLVSERVITFIWYLNNVDEGGETEFYNLKVTPKQGNILFFPAGWLYPHSGKMPISNDKYIITGWLYKNVKSNL